MASLARATIGVAAPAPRINFPRSSLILGVLSLSFAAGCQRPMQQAQGAQAARRPLPPPQGPPKIHRLEFTRPQEGWPPRPKGRTNTREVPWREVPGALTDELEARIRLAVQADGRVRELLGDRFAYIGIHEVERDKMVQRDPFPPLVTLTYFSYANNVAVEVDVQGFQQVRDARNRAGYKPPEGEQEVREAIDLARAEPRLRDRVAGLVGTAILMPRAKDHPDYPNRVLYVTFHKAVGTAPLYWATVDLTARRVLGASPSPRDQ
jgi:hypothetical protein